MNYLPLESLKNAWVFKHKNLLISESDLAKIKPMTTERANTLWDTFISRQVDHPDFFKKGDWPADTNNWSDQGKWEGIWESNDLNLPELIEKHLAWDQNTVVYYCSARNNVIETSWQVFSRCWKNFLFMDDGSILLGKKRQQVVQFTNNGYFKIGQKP